MSEREPWMPSDEEINAVLFAPRPKSDDEDPYAEVRWAAGLLVDLRALIRSAVKKATKRARLEAKIEEAHMRGCDYVVDGLPIEMCGRCSRIDLLERQLAALDRKGGK